MSAMKKMVLISQAEYSQMTSNTIKRPAGTTRFQTMQNLLDESQDSRREKQESHKTNDKKCSNNNDSNDDDNVHTDEDDNIYDVEEEHDQEGEGVGGEEPQDPPEGPEGGQDLDSPMELGSKEGGKERDGQGGGSRGKKGGRARERKEEEEEEEEETRWYNNKKSLLSRIGEYMPSKSVDKAKQMAKRILYMPGVRIDDSNNKIVLGGYNFEYQQFIDLLELCLSKKKPSPTRISTNFFNFLASNEFPLNLITNSYVKTEIINLGHEKPDSLLPPSATKKSTRIAPILKSGSKVIKRFVSSKTVGERKNNTGIKYFLSVSSVPHDDS